jgi:hypothetical protein
MLQCAVPPTSRSIPHAAGDRALKPGMGLTRRQRRGDTV